MRLIDFRDRGLYYLIRDVVNPLFDARTKYDPRKTAWKAGTRYRYECEPEIGVRLCPVIGGYIDQRHPGFAAFIAALESVGEPKTVSEAIERVNLTEGAVLRKLVRSGKIGLADILALQNQDEYED
jgi:hypothetical protein